MGMFGQGRRNTPLSGDYMPGDILGNAVPPITEMPEEHPLTSLLKKVMGVDGPQPMDERQPTAASGASPSSGPASGSSSPEAARPSLVLPGSNAPQPIDHSHLDELESRRQKMEQPLGWKAKLLRAGEMALPVALGAALGGRAGATGALQGDVTAGNADIGRKQKANESLVKQIEDERNRVNQQGMEQTRINAGQPLQHAQIENINSEIAHRDDFKRSQALPTINAEDAEGNAKVMMWNPDTQAYDKPQGGMPSKSANTATDEFEREWANDPKNKGKKPTLQDKIAYEAQLHKGERQPPYPTYTPTVDTAGNVIGRFNNRTGLAEKVSQEPGAPQRKTGMPGAQVTREIQATAIGKSKDDLFAYIDKNLGVMGPVKGRWNNITALWGDTSPEAQELKGKIMSYAALQPGLHGMRNVQLVKEIQDRLGNTKLTPKALKAGLEGMAQAATSIKGATDDFYGGGSAQGNVEQWGRDANGKLVKK